MRPFVLRMCTIHSRSEEVIQREMTGMPSLGVPPDWRLGRRRDPSLGQRHAAHLQRVT